MRRYSKVMVSKPKKPENLLNLFTPLIIQKFLDSKAALNNKYVIDIRVGGHRCLTVIETDI